MKNWNADEWHLFLCQHCDNRATSPNGLNKVALAIVDEIDEVTAAKRQALERCRVVLGNMALENESGLKSIFDRWPISHEPLRADAKGLLPVIDAALSYPD